MDSAVARWRVVMSSLRYFAPMNSATAIFEEGTKSLYETAAFPLTLQSVIDAVPVGIVVLDNGANVVAFNDSWTYLAHEAKCTENHFGLGRNYLGICEHLGEEGVEFRKTLHDCLSGLIDRPSRIFTLILGQNEEAFSIEIRRFRIDGEFRIFLLHQKAGSSCFSLDSLVDAYFRIQIDERRRIAREIHDSTAQHLVAVEIFLSQLKRSGMNPVQNAQLSEAEECAKAALREIRSFSYLLHPTFEGGDDFMTALEHYVSGYAKRISLPINFFAKVDEPYLIDGLENVIMRVTQEALANVHRHAQASKAAVRLFAKPNAIALVVADDGSNGTAHEAKSDWVPGVGLASMRRRLEELGGNLHIVRSTYGTRLIAVLRARPTLREAF